MFPAPIVPFIRQSDFAVRMPWRVPARRLLDYLLIFVQQGHCVVTVDGIAYDFHQGDFCLIQPNELHTLQGKTNTITPFAHLDIFYNPRREESFPTRPGQVDLASFRHLIQPRLNDFYDIQIPVQFRPSQPVRFQNLMLKMVGLWQNQDIISQLEAQNLASELVLLLLRDYSHLDTTPAQQPQSLNWITSYLSFHLAEPLTVADMARQARLSPSRFSVLFRQYFGVPPHQYLLHLRLQHAQELLRTTNLTLQQIAEHCGFADVHHFAKAFKKVVGTSPGAYRLR